MWECSICSLRRARLDVEETSPSPAASDNRGKKADIAPSTVTSKAKKPTEPAKSVQVKNTVKPKTAKNEAFSRTDCGRFSVRTPKTTIQVICPCCFYLYTGTHICIYKLSFTHIQGTCK